MFDRESMQSALRAALVVVVHEHAELFDFGVSERGLVHHLAIALRPMIPPEFDVDVEYNRKERIGEMKRAVDGGAVTPDLLIHQRGVVNLTRNILVLEAKRIIGRQKRDREKVIDMMKQYQYRHGVTLAFGTRRLPFEPTWSWWEAPAAPAAPRGVTAAPVATATTRSVAVFPQEEAGLLYEEGKAIAEARFKSRQSRGTPGRDGLDA